MKKTYLMPAMLTVTIHPTGMIAESFTIDNTTEIDGKDILVKDIKTTDINLWDNEW